MVSYGVVWYMAWCRIVLYYIVLYCIALHCIVLHFYRNLLYFIVLLNLLISSENVKFVVAKSSPIQSLPKGELNTKD